MENHKLKGLKQNKKSKIRSTIFHQKFRELSLVFFNVECRDLVRNMLNPDQNERFSAEQAFRSAWCMKALKDNPNLRYLDEHLMPVPVRKPSECTPPETDEFGKNKLVTTEQFYLTEKANERRKPQLAVLFSFPFHRHFVSRNIYL